MSRLLTVFMLVCLGGMHLFGGVNADLEEAYKKEYAFLVAQKKALETRLAEVKKESKGKIDEAERTIANLQEKFIAKTTLSERKAQSLTDAERDMEGVKDNSGLTEATLMQAEATLEKYGYKAAAKVKPYVQLESVYVYAAQTLGTLDKVR